MKTDTKEFDSRIDIEKRTCTLDSRHNEIETWELYHRCAAGASFENQSAAVEQSRLDLNTVAVFKVRYCKKTAAVVPELFRVRYGDRLWRILSAVNVSGARHIVKIKAVADHVNAEEV